jgi:glutamate-ammonia-ligase adenylyltransferase
MSVEKNALAPFHVRLRDAPLGSEDGRVRAVLADLQGQVRSEAVLSADAELLAAPAVRRLVGGIIAGSPYLTALMQRDPVRLGARAEGGGVGGAAG